MTKPTLLTPRVAHQICSSRPFNLLQSHRSNSNEGESWKQHLEKSSVFWNPHNFPGSFLRPGRQLFILPFSLVCHAISFQQVFFYDWISVVFKQITINDNTEEYHERSMIITLKWTQEGIFPSVMVEGQWALMNLIKLCLWPWTQHTYSRWTLGNWAVHCSGGGMPRPQAQMVASECTRWIKTTEYMLRPWNSHLQATKKKHVFSVSAKGISSSC